MNIIERAVKLIRPGELLRTPSGRSTFMIEAINRYIIPL